MTAALRHGVGFPNLGLLRPLCHALATSAAASPVCGGVSTRRPPRPTSTLPTFTPRYVLRLTVGSLLTPVRLTPRAPDVSRWLAPLEPERFSPNQAACSPAACSRPATRCLTPCPSFGRVFQVRTLLARVPCVAVVRLRLGASRCTGVPALCPVFSGLQTGWCSWSPACRISLGVVGATPARRSFFMSMSITAVCFVAHRDPRAVSPLWLDSSPPCPTRRLSARL
jgi:hypothetical protein